jgi:hypothetical protein
MGSFFFTYFVFTKAYFYSRIALTAVQSRKGKKTMATTIHPELSRKNKYWIERHRYYELKHFCLQYPIWKKAYLSFDGIIKHPSDLEKSSKTGQHGDPTLDCVMERLFYSERIEMVERSAQEADFVLSKYILQGVTEGVSYDYLKARLNIPCCKDVYYELYRRFFWILDKERK